jgi:hypothetical protein
LNSVIVVVVVNAIYICRLVGEVTVNDNVVSFPLSCPLLSYFVMSLHTDCVRVYACVRKERERERETKTEREPRAANERRRSEGQASARARERE